jgi:polyprenyl P-hydroxybenzoate/phenylacrylic acid decarboxylase-like protein
VVIAGFEIVEHVFDFAIGVNQETDAVDTVEAARMCGIEGVELRETPLHLGHLRLMTQAAELGAMIMPPVPAFYHRPQTLDDVINQTVNRVLDQFDIELPDDLFTRWQGA